MALYIVHGCKYAQTAEHEVISTGPAPSNYYLRLSEREDSPSRERDQGTTRPRQHSCSRCYRCSRITKTHTCLAERSSSDMSCSSSGSGKHLKWTEKKLLLKNFTGAADDIRVLFEKQLESIRSVKPGSVFSTLLWPNAGFLFAHKQCIGSELLPICLEDWRIKQQFPHTVNVNNRRQRARFGFAAF